MAAAGAAALCLLGAAASASGASAPRPNVIQIVADDLGFNDVWELSGDGSHLLDNPNTFTPNINALIRDGIALTAYHTYKVCSPSRASIHTGRYPWGVGYYDMKGPEAIPLGFKLLPQLMKVQGYSTHAMGKWNLGHQLKPYTPTRRGYDTFLGYYAACQVDYWYHGAPADECGTNAPGDAVTDFSNSTASPDAIAPAEGLNGTYNEEIFTAEAERLIAAHAASGAPLYVYLAYQNVHGAANEPSLTLQAPEDLVAMYNRTQLDTYKVAGAMITALDRGVGRVRSALDAAGIAANSVITFCSDNGGPLDHATNAPLRGGKHTLWDGGLRVTAWVWSPLIPASRRGAQWGGLMHASDWLPTIAFGMAGADPTSATGPRPLDGHDLWAAWTTANATSPRTEIIHQVVNRYCNGSAGPGASVAPFSNTIRVGKYKLIGGVPGDTNLLPWPQPSKQAVPFGLTNGTTEPGTDHCRAGGVKDQSKPHPCNPWCLFDLEADLSESKDLAGDPAYAQVVEQLAARVEAAAATGPPWAWPFADAVKSLEQEMCAAAAKTGFIEPLRETPPPSAAQF